MELRDFQVLRELFIELSERVSPTHLAVFDLVQLLFHVGRVRDIEQIIKAFDKQVINDNAQLSREKARFLSLNVFAVLDDGHYGSISRRTSDPLFLERLHQRSLSVARGRLCKMLLVFQVVQCQMLAFFDWGELPRLFVVLLVFFVLTFFVNSKKSVELDYRPSRAEEISWACVYIDRRLINQRRHHL